MRIDDRISGERIKAALKEKRHIFGLVGIALLCLVLFTTLTNINRRVLTVWESSSLKDSLFNAESEGMLIDRCTEAGLEFSLLIRSPLDDYYDIAFSTSGVYISDILVLTGEEMEAYSESDVFLPLDGTLLSEYSDSGYERDGVLYGIYLADDRYLAVNVNCDVDIDFVIASAILIYTEVKGI